jgi:hypothetical protein
MLLFLILSKKNHKNLLLICVYRLAKCHYSAMNAVVVAPIPDVRKAAMLERWYEQNGMMFITILVKTVQFTLQVIIRIHVYIQNLRRN